MLLLNPIIMQMLIIKSGKSESRMKDEGWIGLTDCEEFCFVVFFDSIFSKQKRRRNIPFEIKACVIFHSYVWFICWVWSLFLFICFINSISRWKLEKYSLFGGAVVGLEIRNFFLLLPNYLMHSAFNIQLDISLLFRKRMDLWMIHKRHRTKWTGYRLFLIFI